MQETGEFAKGWRVVLGAFIGIGGGFASLYFYSAGLFIKPLAAEYGWTRSEASLGSISLVIGSVFALPVAGRLIDRHGEIRVAFCSGLALAACFAMLGGLTGGLASFLMLVTLLCVVSAGSNAIGYNRLIVRNFVARRGLALGLALTGTAIGAALVPPLLAPFIAEHGWRPAYFVLAALCVILTSCAALLLKGHSSPRSERQEAQPITWREICGHRAFYTISALIFLSATAVLGTTMHIVPMLTDRGMSIATAGAVASALGIAVIGGRVVAGQLLDSWDAGWVGWLLLTFAALGALLLWTGLPWLIVPGTMLIGFGVGTETDLLAYLLGRRFPVRSFGSVYGTIFAVHALGGGVGGMLAGAMYDLTGGYASWLLLASIALALAGLISLLTERKIVAVTE